MTPYQKGITELVGVFKERFGILISAEQAACLVVDAAQPEFAAGQTIERWNAYGNTSGQPDMERKA